MTVSPVALRRKTERKPHPTALLEKCDVEALFGLPSSTSFTKPPKSTAKISTRAKSSFPPCCPSKPAAPSEDCAYCPQSAHHNTNLGKEQMMDVDEIVEKAKIAKSRGAKPFSAWARHGVTLKPKDVRRCPQSSKPSRLGMETCGTFGMLEDGMAEDFKKPVWTTTTTTSTPTPNATTTSSTPVKTRRPHGYFGQSPQCRFESLLRRYRRHEREPAPSVPD